MWNLEKWYRCSYLHTRNRDTDVENKSMNTKGEKQVVGGIGKLVLTYTHHWYVRAKSLQSCPTPCDHVDCTPLGFSVLGGSLGKNTGVDCHALLQGIFLIQGWNLCFMQLLHHRGILHCWATWEAHIFCICIYLRIISIIPYLLYLCIAYRKDMKTPRNTQMKVLEWEL